MNLLVNYEELDNDMREYVDDLLDEIKRCPSCDSRAFRPDGNAITSDSVIIKMICGACGEGHSTSVDPDAFGLFMCDWAYGLIDIQNAAMESESHSGMMLEVDDDSE